MSAMHLPTENSGECSICFDAWPCADAPDRGAVARAMALAAGDPNWMNVTMRPKD